MSSKTVKDLVPGDPEEIWRLADSYNRMATICEEVGHGFRGIDDGGWSGRAAGAFRARFERQPNRFLTVADNYGRAAVALDTYAAALAWAQRQAGEVIAWDDKESQSSRPARPVLTMTQQAELTGVITGTGQPEPARVRDDPRTLVLSTYRRALAMLDTVGNESATAIMAAAESMPASSPPTEPSPSADGTTSSPTPASTAVTGLVIRDVVPQQAAPPRVDPTALRDDLQDWAVAIREIRKRLRWDGLNRQSPRLVRHLFDGDYDPGKPAYTGYHHREGGVDHGELRVVEVLDGPDPYGVYSAYVGGPRARKKYSTFFPDSWSRAEVLYAVRHVFLDAMRNKANKWNYDPARRRFRGVYREVQIKGYLDPGAAEPRLCDIRTAHPRRVRQQRERS